MTQITLNGYYFLAYQFPFYHEYFFLIGYAIATHYTLPILWWIVSTGSLAMCSCQQSGVLHFAFLKCVILSWL